MLKFQSGFRKGYSTETYVTQLKLIESRCLLSGHKGSVWPHMVDHEILINRLAISFVISGWPLDWLWSFLDGRTIYGNNQLRLHGLNTIAIQCPTELCTQATSFHPIYGWFDKFVASFGAQIYQYADDLQLYSECHHLKHLLLYLLQKCRNGFLLLAVAESNSQV